jgi:hypothetical protein
MKNLSRVLGLSTALILTGLTIPASASTLGNCFVRCAGAPGSNYSITTTRADCCSGNVPNFCPAGSTPYGASWNSLRC